MSRTSPEGLVRGIRRWDLVAIAINAIIGAGIFGLPSKTYALIGTYSLMAFVVCALVVVLIILCFAEVGSRFDETGGPYLYAREAFGPTVAFEVGWLIWLARVTAFAANFNLMIAYLSDFWPGAKTPIPRTILIVLVVVGLTTINLLGVRRAAIFSNLFTVGKLIPILIFIAAGLFFLNPHVFTLGARPSAGNFSKSVLLLIYAFTGFEMATIPAGETRDPRKDLPQALLKAIAVVAIAYILIQAVCIGTLPDLGNSSMPLADAARRFLGKAGGAIISAGVVISVVGNLNIVLLSGSRMPFAIAEQGQLPAILAKVHRRYFTPFVAILVTAPLMLVLTLKTSFLEALTISTIARLVTYAVTCAALPVLRWRKGIPAPLFKIRGGPVIAVAALILAAWLLVNNTFRTDNGLKEAYQAAIAALVGLLIYVVYRIYRARAS